MQPRIVSLCQQSCLRILSGFAIEFILNHRFDINMRFPFYIVLSTVVLLCTLKMLPFGYDLFVVVIYSLWSVWDGWGNDHDEIAMEKVLFYLV